MKAVCDLTRPSRVEDGERWAASLERACDWVMRSCVGLDPADTAGPRRTSDGRSVWVAPTSRHMTSDRILGEEDYIISWAMEAQDAEPEPSRNRRRRRPRRDASRSRTSGGRQRPTRARRRPGRRRQDDHAAHSRQRSARQLTAGVRRRTVGQGRPCPRTGDRGAVRHARQAAPRVGTTRPPSGRRVRTSARSDRSRRRSRHGRHVRARPTRLARRTPGLATRPDR